MMAHIGLIGFGSSTAKRFEQVIRIFAELTPIKRFTVIKILTFLLYLSEFGTGTLIGTSNFKYRSASFLSSYRMCLWDFQTFPFG
jgi:hypothetical protein